MLIRPDGKTYLWRQRETTLYSEAGSGSNFYIKTVTGHALKNKNQQRRSRITDWTYTDCF